MVDQDALFVAFTVAVRARDGSDDAYALIGFVHLSSVYQHKITRSKGSGIKVVGKCDQIVKSSQRLSSFCFLTLGTRHA